MPEGPTATPPIETIYVDDRVVACDGGDGPLGHPRVFLRIENRQVCAPIARACIILNEGAGHASGH